MENKEPDMKLTLKETLVILAISILLTPILYEIVFADFGWYLKYLK